MLEGINMIIMYVLKDSFVLDISITLKYNIIMGEDYE
jgi:hypothetical protein